METLWWLHKKVLFILLFVLSALSLPLAAQVTVNTGSTAGVGPNGILMSEGSAAITTASGSDSIFGDSGSHRVKVINNGGSAQVLATWPCTSAGCISFGTTVVSGVAPETALTLGALGVPLLAGSSAPQWGATNLNLKTTAIVAEVANDTTTGTTVNLLAKLTSTGAIKATTSDTNVPTYIVANAGGGTSGNAQLAQSGRVSCTMDATLSNTEGFLVTTSVNTAGDCAASATVPPGTWVVGIMVSNSTTAGSNATVLAQPRRGSYGNLCAGYHKFGYRKFSICPDRWQHESLRFLPSLCGQYVKPELRCQHC